MKSLRILFAVTILIIGTSIFSQNVVVVIIDGARYTETFGDPDRTYIPYMSELAQQGTYIDEFYNNGATYTSRAVPALWCGAWTEINDTVFNGMNTQYTVSPSIFEYFEKQKQPGQNQNIHTLAYVYSLWLQSFHSEYGQDYWPTTICQGSSDVDVLENALEIMEEDQPRLLWVYLSDVDHEGHSGIWNNYTQSIRTADSIVHVLWTEIQNNPNYANNTSLFVTNDHGRHTNDFSGHGCGCEGCRHIMFLALGPNIKEDFVSTQIRNIPDFAVTAASVLEVEMEYATGEIATEIFSNTGASDFENYKLVVHSGYVSFFLSKSTNVKLEIIDLKGNVIQTLISEKRQVGKNTIRINNQKLRGVYLIRFTTSEYYLAQKVFF